MAAEEFEAKVASSSPADARGAEGAWVPEAPDASARRFSALRRCASAPTESAE